MQVDQNNPPQLFPAATQQRGGIGSEARAAPMADCAGWSGLRRAVTLPFPSREAKFQIHDCCTIFQDEFLAGGQSLTPPAGPRPRDRTPGEGRTLSSEDS